MLSDRQTFLDNVPRESFERVARLAASSLQASLAFVCTVRDGRVAVRGKFDTTGTPAADDEIAELDRVRVADAIASGRVALIHSERGGSGASPLIVVPFSAEQDSAVLGALCVVGATERDWSDRDVAAIAGLVETLSSELTLHSTIYDRKEEEVKLRHTTLHDPLTELPNRTLFMQRTDQAIARAKRYPDHLFAILFLDLDRFKVVNDSLGHQVGDELLVAVARRLEKCLRTEDTVARLGGDEFGILLDRIRVVADAARVAQRILMSLAEPVNLSGYEVYTSASIGIVDSATAHGIPEYMIRSADMAMYRAKGAGKARYEMFDRAMHADALARLQLETDLRHAVQREEFIAHYQPVVSLETGQIAGFEALIRWKHPERGLVPPNDFIPMAEETGMILPMGQWIMREACRQVSAWQQTFRRAEPLAIGVNLSVKQFAQPDLKQLIADIVETTGVHPNSLKLEITESVIVGNTDHAITVLEGLKSIGLEIYMDDFGTGYSSLSYLTHLPIDCIKIDRSFVSQMETKDRHFQLVRTILTLARSVNLRSVAEGVESTPQLLALRKLGCEFGQGYLFSRPLPPAEIEELLARNPSW
ncbi:MAG: EAL domain-containing protein [Anaerolineae bacterium]|nr:EAL domain-containing protein [Gemmatimonadaceae bacterium]